MCAPGSALSLSCMALGPMTTCGFEGLLQGKEHEPWRAPSLEGSRYLSRPLKCKPHSVPLPVPVAARLAHAACRPIGQSRL